MSRGGKKKGRAGHDEGPTIRIDVARWEAARRRWFLKHIGAVVLFPALIGYGLYHDSLIKGRPAGPPALPTSGLLMLILSLAFRWIWRSTSSAQIAPPALVSIKEAPSSERVLVKGSVIVLDSIVTGLASGRQGVHCHLELEVEFRSKNGPSWGSHHRREWNAPFLIGDGSGSYLRLDGKCVYIDPELSQLTLTYESKTGVSGLPEQIQRYIKEKKIYFKESEQNIRVVESVLGEGDELTVIGHLTAPRAHAPSSYRSVAPAQRELGDVELITPLSLDDLRRLDADHKVRTWLLNAGIFVGIGLFIASALMARG